MTRLLALAFTSAAIISAAHRPWGPGYLAWVALVPLLVLLVTQKRWWRGAVAAGIASLGTGLVAFEGVAPAEFWAYPILAVVAAIPWAVAGGLFVLTANRLGRTAALWSFAPLLVAGEFIASQRTLLGGFANGMSALGYTQFDTPLLAAAGWSGVTGVSLLVVGINVAVYSLWRRRPAPAALWLGVTLIATLVPVPGSSMPNLAATPLRVAVAQGAVSSIDTLLARFDEEAARRMVEPYANLTTQAADHDVDLVVWGETVLPHAVRPGHVPSYVADALAPAPVALVGGVSFTNGQSYNSIFHWQDGELTEVFRKRALVPFNESHYTAGRQLPPLAVNGVPVGLGVCLDSVFGSLAREAVRSGAELLVYVTEDSFAVRTVTPELHLRATAFRAAETGRYVVFANQSGPSAIIDNRGHIVDRIAHGDAAGLVTRVPAYQGGTPFVRLGDWVGLLACLTVAAALASALLNLRAARRRGETAS